LLETNTEKKRRLLPSVYSDENEGGTASLEWYQRKKKGKTHPRQGSAALAFGDPRAARSEGGPRRREKKEVNTGIPVDKKKRLISGVPSTRQKVRGKAFYSRGKQNLQGRGEKRGIGDISLNEYM